MLKCFYKFIEKYKYNSIVLKKGSIMVDEVKKVQVTGLDEPKKLKKKEPAEVKVGNIEIVKEDKVKEDVALKGFTIEREAKEDEPAFADDKDAQKIEVKKRTNELRKELEISKRHAKRLAKSDVQSEVAGERIDRNNFYLDDAEYEKAMQDNPDGHHVNLTKYKKVLEKRPFDAAFEGRKRDPKTGEITDFGKLNQDRLKQIARDWAGEDDNKLDLDENVAGAASAGLTNKKGRVRRKDARIYRHMFRDMGFNIEKDKTELKRGLHVLKSAGMGAASGALLGPVMSELTGLLGVKGTVAGVASGYVTGYVEGAVTGKTGFKGKTDYTAGFKGQTDYTAGFKGQTDYTAGYNGNVNGSVDYNAGYSGNVGGSVDYNAGYNGNVGGSVDYNAGYSGNVGGSVDYNAGYSGNVGGSVDYNAGYNGNVGGSADYSVDSTAYYIQNGKVVATDTQTATGSVDYNAGYSGNVGGSVDYNAGYSGNVGGSVDYNAGYSGNVGGSVDYNAGYSGNVGGSVDYNAGYNGNVGGSVDYNAGYSGNVGGSVDYNAGYNGTVSGSADYQGTVSGKADYAGQVSGKADYAGKADYTADYKAKFDKDYKADYKADYNAKPSWGKRMLNGGITGFVGGAVSGVLTMGKVNDIKRPPTVDVLQGRSVDEVVQNRLVNGVKGKTSQAIMKKIFESGASDDVIKKEIRAAMGRNTGKRLTEAELFQAYKNIKEQMAPEPEEPVVETPIAEEPTPTTPTIPVTPIVIEDEVVEEEPLPTVEDIVAPAAADAVEDDNCTAEAKPVDKKQDAPEMHIDIRGKYLYDAVAKGYNIKKQTDLYDAIGQIKEKHNISQGERSKNKGIADLYLEETIQAGGTTYKLNKNLKREDIKDIPKADFAPGETSRTHKKAQITVQAGKVTLSCNGEVREYSSYIQAQNAADYYNKHGKFPEDKK